jgi:hypothetical protein
MCALMRAQTVRPNVRDAVHIPSVQCLVVDDGFHAVFKSQPLAQKCEGKWL